VDAGVRLFSVKRLAAARWFQQTFGFLAAQYIRLVGSTCRVVLEPADAYQRIEPELPVILAMWHGQHMLVPIAKLNHHRAKVLISRHRDGEINAIAAERLGIGTIRGSGAHNTEFQRKGGAVAFTAMVDALANGYTMALTADVPKVARVAGRGIIMLAKVSGRPIVPVAVTTGWRIQLNNWDRSTINLPFSRAGGVVGRPIRVDRDADEAAMEAARRELQSELDAITERARALADGGAGEA
jgi:lysophospholipid acyltransferase (LPLAT)-like uncharacterized protein